MTAARLKRFVLLMHRWGGVAGCALMVLWLVSGLVMLFVGYPKLLPAEHLGALVPLDRNACCVPVEGALLHSHAPRDVRQIRLTSVAHQPRYVLREAMGDYAVVDAITGQRIHGIDGDAAVASAMAFLPNAKASLQGLVTDDRWTHSGALDGHRPLYQVQMDDAESTLLYVSSTTGEVVMDAPLAQRRWNLVGAWLHWLYMFREGSRDAVWSWTVIVLSTAATLVALTGAMAGLWRWRFKGRYKSGARTPYRALPMRWHHISGLAFGTGLIAWVFSGLMSMNPVGVFNAKGLRPNLEAYHQGLPGGIRPSMAPAEVLAMLQQQGFSAREIEWRVLAGRPYLLARDGAGGTRLLVADQAGAISVLARWPISELEGAGARLFEARAQSAEWLGQHDAFYYQRGTASMYGAAERRLPVLKMRFSDAGETQVYLDPYTGDLALSADRSQRLGRWMFNLLHSWDLQPLLRWPMLREALLIALSLGSLAIALTGCVIGWRRVRHRLRHP